MPVFDVKKFIKSTEETNLGARSEATFRDVPKRSLDEDSDDGFGEPKKKRRKTREKKERRCEMCSELIHEDNLSKYCGDDCKKHGMAKKRLENRAKKEQLAEERKQKEAKEQRAAERVRAKEAKAKLKRVRQSHTDKLNGLFKHPKAAAALEKNIFKQCGKKVDDAYKSRFGDIFFNLKNNDELLQSILQGKVTVKELSKMNVKEMATEKQKAERRKAEEALEKELVLKTNLKETLTQSVAVSSIEEKTAERPPSESPASESPLSPLPRGSRLAVDCPITVETTTIEGLATGRKSVLASATDTSTTMDLVSETTSPKTQSMESSAAIVASRQSTGDSQTPIVEEFDLEREKQKILAELSAKRSAELQKRRSEMEQSTDSSMFSSSNSESFTALPLLMMSSIGASNSSAMQSAEFSMGLLTDSCSQRTDETSLIGGSVFSSVEMKHTKLDSDSEDSSDEELDTLMAETSPAAVVIESSSTKTTKESKSASTKRTTVESSHRLSGGRKKRRSSKSECSEKWRGQLQWEAGGIRTRVVVSKIGGGSAVNVRRLIGTERIDVSGTFKCSDINKYLIQFASSKTSSKVNQLALVRLDFYFRESEERNEEVDKCKKALKILQNKLRNAKKVAVIDKKKRSRQSLSPFKMYIVPPNAAIDTGLLQKVFGVLPPVHKLWGLLYAK